MSPDASPLDLQAASALAARPAVARLLALLGGGGEEARVVGGAVRNALLGRHVHEIDLATTTPPGETMRRAKAAGLRAVPTGFEHGTVTILVAGEPYEVTTLREDVETDGRHATVRFGRDFALDAARRDFTVNALSVDQAGRIHDTTDGLADLAAGRIRFIGEAGLRIREDYLRALRFFRFHADYATGPVDPDGLAAAIAARDGLARLSRERIRAEILKLLVARRAVETVALLQETGLLLRLTGGVAELGRLARVAAVGEEAPADRLAALLVRIREDADRLRAALRLSNEEHARLLGYAGALVGLKAEAWPLDPAALRRRAVLHGLPALGLGVTAFGEGLRPLLTDEARAILARYLSGAETPPVFPLTGAELIRRGATPGPALGRALAEARAAWLAAGCPP